MKKFKFTIRGNDYDVEVKKIEDDVATIDVNGSRFKVEIHRKKQTTKTPTLVRKPVPKNNGGVIEKKASSAYQVKAPLPGTIVSLSVKEGDTVSKGQTVLIMEAMKMENNINTEKEGTVIKILVNAGDTVLQNDVLIEIA